MKKRKNRQSSDSVHKRLAINLRRILDRKRVSEEELARRTGYKLRFVREILAGRSSRLSMEGIEKIAVALGVTAAILVGPPVVVDP